MYISKTKVKQNKQCVKLLYLETNSPKLKEITSDVKKIFEKGKLVESIAKSNFPGGKTVNAFKHDEKIRQTELLLKREKVIFEASFAGDNIFIQVDILVKNDDGTYDAIEVKSGTKVNDEYFEDVLIQYFSIKKSNKIILKNYYVWYINKHATSEKDLFVKDNIIDKVSVLEDRFNELVKAAKETVALKQEPDIKIGPQCSSPYECPFKKYCWKNHLTDPKSVLNLPNMKDKWKLFDGGIEYINSPGFPINEYKEKNPEIAEAILKNTLEINREKVLSILNTYTYPLYFFDVETLMVPVPVLKDQKPYQQVVIQYSIHELRQDKTIIRKDFLHDSKENPDRSFIETLIADVGEYGDIVVYNKTFESSRLKEIAEKPQYADLKEKIYKIIARFQDFLDVIKKNVYHPGFQGSFSLKSITPVLIQEYEGYVNSQIKNGSEVSDLYVQFLNETDLVKKDQLRQVLYTYNRLDTINVLLIYLFLIDKDFQVKVILDSIA